MSKAKQVLIVEDERDIREMLCEFLAGAGYTVSTVENGVEALKILKSGARPDVIVLDLMMPIMSGGQLLTELQASEDWRSIPVLLMTAANVPTLTPQVAGVVRKPFKVAQFLSTLKNVLDSKPGL